VIAAIENAIIARLKAAGDAGVLGYQYRTLESYPADWDAYLREKVIRAPAAWAVFAGMQRGETVGFGGLRAEAHFGLVVMAENARNETAQRHGGPSLAEPGSYQLAMDAIALLQGQDLGLPIDAIEVRGCHVVRTMEIVKDRKVAMLALELVTSISIQAASTGLPADTAAPGALGDFKTFHADWDVPPFGGIDADPAAEGVQLPDDAHADAVDHVSLETDA